MWNFQSRIVYRQFDFLSVDRKILEDEDRCLKFIVSWWDSYDFQHISINRLKIVIDRWSLELEKTLMTGKGKRNVIHSIEFFPLSFFRRKTIRCVNQGLIQRYYESYRGYNYIQISSSFLRIRRAFRMRIHRTDRLLRSNWAWRKRKRRKSRDKQQPLWRHRSTERKFKMRYKSMNVI